MPSEAYRRDLILKYIKDNNKRTKADVIRYMQEVGASSTMTTHKLIMDLASEEKIIVLKDKPNSQIHRLIINDKNDYNLINEQLLEIEAFFEEMSDSIMNMKRLRDKSEKDRDLVPDLTIQFSPYFSSMDIMLQFLLIQTNRVIHNYSESQLFNSRIAKLIAKLKTQQVSNNHTIERQRLVSRLIKMIPNVVRLSPNNMTRVRKKGINPDLIDKTYIIYEDFMERFRNSF